MSDILTPQKNFTVNVANEDEHELIVKLGRALAVIRGRRAGKAEIAVFAGGQLLKEEIEIV